MATRIAWQSREELGACSEHLCQGRPAARFSHQPRIRVPRESALEYSARNPFTRKGMGEGNQRRLGKAASCRDIPLSPCFGVKLGIPSYCQLSPCFGVKLGIPSYCQLSPCFEVILGIPSYRQLSPCFGVIPGIPSYRQLSPCFGVILGIPSYRQLSPCFGVILGIPSYRQLSPEGNQSTETGCLGTLR